MIRQTANQRLHYIGGGVRVQQYIPTAAANWWEIAGETCVAAYQPKGAASLAASYSNLANPGTYDAAPGVAPTWDTANGWYGNNTKYLTTGIIPASGWSAVVRFSGLSIADQDQVLLGCVTTGNTYVLLQPRYSASESRYYGNGGLSAAIAGRLTGGVMAVAGQQGYLDGSTDGSTFAAWSGTSTRDIYILAFNANGTATAFMNGYIQAVAIYSTTLDASQIASLTTAMNAL